MRGARGLGRFNPSLGSALRPSRAGRAPCPGDEEAFAPPAQIAAAAGRLLHCLTTTRAGFSPRPANLRDTSLWKIRELLPRDQKRRLE